MTIKLIYILITKSYLWVKWGGEAINYNDKLNRETIVDVFYKIQNEVK